MLSADVFNQQFRVRVKIENPNAAPLRIKTINYKLFLETDSFAEGASVLPLVVPANDEKEFDLTVQTNFASSIGRLLSRLNGTNSNTMQYTFSGDVVIDASFSPKLKFAESGTVNLSRR
jgi:LEA14-like dessication related protein